MSGVFYVKANLSIIISVQSQYSTLVITLQKLFPIIMETIFALDWLDVKTPDPSHYISQLYSKHSMKTWNYLIFLIKSR